MDSPTGVGSQKRDFLVSLDNSSSKKATPNEPTAAKDIPLSKPPLQVELTNVTSQSVMECREYFSSLASSWNRMIAPEDSANFGDLNNADCLRVGIALVLKGVVPLLDAERKIAALEADKRILTDDVVGLKTMVASLEMETIKAKDRALGLLEQVGDIHDLLTSSLKKVASSEAEISAKTAEIDGPEEESSIEQHWTVIGQEDLDSDPENDSDYLCNSRSSSTADESIGDMESASDAES